MTIQKGIFIATVSLAGLALFGCGSSKPGGGGSIATVNGTPVSQSDLYQHLLTKNTVEVSAGSLSNGDKQMVAQSLANGRAFNMPTSGPIGLQAFNDLVKETLILKMAEDEGVAPTDKDVEAEIAHRRDLDPSFVANLNKQGHSLGDIRRMIRVSLSQSNLLTKGIEVSDEEVDKYIEANPDITTQPATAELLMVAATSQATKTNFDAAFASGKTFEEVASEINDDNNLKALGGKMNGGRPVAIAQLDEKLKVAVEATSINKATDWIPIQAGDGQAWVKVFVLAKKKEKKIEMTPARKKQIKRMIAENRGREGKDLDKELLDKYLAADVNIQEDGLEKLWEAYDQAVLEPQRKKLGIKSPPKDK